MMIFELYEQATSRQTFLNYSLLPRRSLDMVRNKDLALALKRAYEFPSPDDGFRVLVERLWPRGLKKAEVALDLWLKEIAPSQELRQWFGHDPAKWQEFCRRYWAELAAHPEAVMLLKDKLRQGKVTLVYGSKDEEHNAAVALKKYLEGQAA
jgi:uncharacterized protein YeaO (DUF488 family)